MISRSHFDDFPQKKNDSKQCQMSNLNEHKKKWKLLIGKQSTIYNTSFRFLKSPPHKSI